ncbi:helix-turn-helix transcriptional regulator [Zoogloea sp.]|uniref:AraC family transcriptional regulator n=1 Tax=Zoogloea sp. TaxID=49181 RepID=UPI0014157D42|nr:MAG: AraC family transcriptional regulator [Zoogloea sp.]
MDNLELESLLKVESSLRPVAVLASDLAGGVRIAPHVHRRGQLLHAIHGVMIVRAPGGSWVVPQGRAVWVPAGVEHEIEAPGPVATRTVFIEPGFQRGPEAAACRVIGVTPLLRQLIVTAVDELPLDYPEGGREERLMNLIVDEIERAPALGLHLPMPTGARLAALCRAFLDHPAAEASLADWARQAHLTEKTLARQFLKETGLNMGAWCRQARLLLSLSALAAGRSVLDVALSHGYDSPSAFSAAFRRTFGISPIQYIKGEAGPSLDAICGPASRGEA